ncbi:hypothetical protein AUJ68_02350 [Candidatus Woesearchaeota archaeon CG1_02_57_44]|nr:MAG: hypothetical protein AUJ68_02350 [Candidatus Woesearchaeota archaeon CG1_02_57_44]
MRIAIIGDGRLGAALHGGLCAGWCRRDGAGEGASRGGQRGAHEVRIIGRQRAGCDKVRVMNAAADWADVVLVAVKPRDLPAVLPGLRGALVVSFAAGVTTDALTALMGCEGSGTGDDASHRNDDLRAGKGRHVPCRIVRAMTDIAVEIGEALSVLAPCQECTVDDIALAQEVLSSVGRVCVCQEHEIDAYTALSASGIAFAVHLMDVMAKALPGGAIGAREARQAVLHAFEAGVKMMRVGDAQSIVRKVASPGGTTEAGLRRIATVDEALQDVVRGAYLACRTGGAACGGDDRA